MRRRVTVLNVVRDADDQLLRELHSHQVEDEALAMVRNAVHQLVVGNRLAAKDIQFIVALKNLHAVSQVAVRNDAATPVLENPARAAPVAGAPKQRLAVAPVKVQHPTAVVARQLEHRQLRLIRRTMHGPFPNLERPDRVLHRMRITSVMDYSLQDQRRIPAQNSARQDVVANARHGRIRKPRSLTLPVETAIFPEMQR